MLVAKVRTLRTYVAADYRHIASDVVLEVPFGTGRGRETITLYVLIEHQSEPDSLSSRRWYIMTGRNRNGMGYARQS